MDSEATFRALCTAPQLEAAVRELKPGELARLIDWLKAGHGRGIAGLVLGVAQAEASDRYVQAHPNP